MCSAGGNTIGPIENDSLYYRVIGSYFNKRGRFDVGGSLFNFKGHR